LIAVAGDPAAATRRPGLVLLRAVLLCLVLGGTAALALPPWGFWPAVLAMAPFFALVRAAAGPGPAFLLGWSFGAGWFGLGLYWVAIAFYTDAERFGALAIPAVILLAMACAVFTGLAAAIVRARPWRSLAGQALLFALLWTVGDFLRGSWGAQFPWNPPSTIWAAFDPVLQLAAWIGSPGLSVLTVFLACLPAGLFVRAPGRRWGLAAAAMALFVLAAGGGALRSMRVEPPPSTGVPIRIVQAAIPQDLKWDPAKREDFFLQHLELSRARADTPPRLVIWPESAVPYQIAREPIVRDLIASVIEGDAVVVTGGNRYELEGEVRTASNSLWVIDNSAEVRARYDKVDLVPFGEFLPARPWLEAIGLSNLTAGSFDFAPGPGRETIALAGLPSFSPLICYEAIFPGDAVARSGPRPDFILNITNDGWFGMSAGPHQHLAMARMRSVEEGLPLVRAANTGISVVTDAFGREIGRLELGDRGVLDAELPGRLAEPPLFARQPGIAIALLLGGGFLASGLLELRARRRGL
jgi:apolipoprotein N-acyltransferase